MSFFYELERAVASGGQARLGAKARGAEAREQAADVLGRDLVARADGERLCPLELLAGHGDLACAIRRDASGDAP